MTRTELRKLVASMDDAVRAVQEAIDELGDDVADDEDDSLYQVVDELIGAISTWQQERGYI